MEDYLEGGMGRTDNHIHEGVETGDSRTASGIGLGN